MSVEKVIKAIKKYSYFLITSHIDLEGDALGSELALASLLRRLGKRALIVNASSLPSNYKFLPGAERISSKLSNPAPEAAFIIDCSNKQRIGRVADLIKKGMPIINVDHHIGNKKFGKINWVDTRASSTGEMIYRLFELLQVKPTSADALNIYIAIITDTGMFRYSNTRESTHRICSKLLKSGLEPAKIYTQIYENNSAKDVLLMAELISQVHFTANNQIAWIEIRQRKFKQMKDKPEILGGTLDWIKSINTVKVVLVFSQKDSSLIKLSLRSKSPINVQKIAKLFGGGGHKFASGCTIKSSLKQAEKKVLSQVKRTLNERSPHRQ